MTVWKTSVEIRELLLSMYVDSMMSCATFFKWIGGFQEGREHVFDNEGVGRHKSNGGAHENQSQQKLLCVAERCCRQSWNIVRDHS